VFGIWFQYLVIKPMSQLSRRQALAYAIQADTLSVITVEIGLFGWMALAFLVVFPHLHPDQAAYWFMMQIGMALGLVTTYPAQIWLVRHGVKHSMGQPVLPARSGSQPAPRMGG
jgi:hypothetical protein